MAESKQAINKFISDKTEKDLREIISEIVNEVYNFKCCEHLSSKQVAVSILHSIPEIGDNHQEQHQDYKQDTKYDYIFSFVRSLIIPTPTSISIYILLFLCIYFS